MPPKKKGKGRGKKGKAKKRGEEDGLEEKYRRSALDVAVLKGHLALRHEVARQSQASGQELQARVGTLERELSKEREDKRDISADLTRQYKTMQTELGVRVHQLEGEVSRLRKQLGLCQDALQKERDSREQLELEKEAAIAELQGKIDDMETGYEKILHGCLDSLLTRLAESRRRWRDESTALHLQHKERLADFGLNPLDI
ncbi:dynein regulatory complex protein 12 isoform X1 [Lepisosteus oculatus]|uniref:dynein regulatory complex protein 12 isoform X1 n=1 Tax=Lepisosteus oculatus TaxID=7918 RepID=UPI0035F50F4C